MNSPTSIRFLVTAGSILAFLLILLPSQHGHAQDKGHEDGKFRALLITGGCCHDYNNQKKIISEGISKSLGKESIQWTILEYGSGRDIKADVYNQGDWINGYGIVVHNECFGGVTDGEFVSGIVNAHKKTKVPAIVIHCSMHSYRKSPTAEQWRSLLGVTSMRHERSKHPLDVIKTDAGKQHAILGSMPANWKTANGELYIIQKVWPTTTVLATVYSKETKKDEPVIWVNEVDGVKVFGISLGHHNETMLDPQWQQIVAAGWNWALEN